MEKAFKENYTHINRMLMLKILTNLLSSNVSIKYQLKGPVLSPTIACATSLNAIGEGFKLIRDDEVQVS
jgi:3-oxoacyl-[acyl-carrier-protein] synthase II